MALSTILTKFILMWILMTAGTIRVLNASELLELFTVNRLYFVTLQTLNINMLAGQFVPGIVVIKISCRFK